MTERIVRVEDMGPVERAWAEAMHEECAEPPAGHPLADHSPWSGGDLDGVMTWEEFTALLARHGLVIAFDDSPIDVRGPAPTAAELRRWRERLIAAGVDPSELVEVAR